MDDHLTGILSNIGIISFIALSAYLSLLTGEISFGQQAFFAIGAYVAGIATAMWGWPLAAGLRRDSAIAVRAVPLPNRRRRRACRSERRRRLPRHPLHFRARF